ncbi:hypothetical protein BJY04DRAFT_105052 [Aspergillus karnatakaensis]|uniref:uncharacterized protein n=1 Tax=Aspergillus karnatakaensis TaxID=1810916 RepID=UPI003CCDDAE6
MASSNGKVDSSDRIVINPGQPKPRRTGSIRWTVGLLVRLCIWYFLLTPFFACPSDVSGLTDSSPRICKPYLVAKSHVEPYVTPYYNAYGAPYVESARPYVRVLNEKVYTPASNIAKQGYEAYGAPALAQAQLYGRQQWDANVVPHIQTAKGKATDWYDAQVAPHVEYVTVTVSPYYQKAHGAYWTAVDGYILPFAAKYRPFIGKTYTSGQEILTTTVLPHAQFAWSSTIYLINNSVWPKIANLYSENVEPQLVKIGQRLASYREGNRLRTVADEGESSGYPATSSVEASATESTTSSSVPEPTPAPSLSPSELAAQLREQIASDLITWKERFAAASEKGVESLEGRVVEIVDTFLSTGAQSNGEALVAALESAVADQTSAIKSRIGQLTESLPFEEFPEGEEAAIEELLKEIRNSAVSIRDRAHGLREWHASFEQELVQKVSVAVNATLAVLDNVRTLGLQEVGTRWAWMDGVTYNDWEDYYALKAEFEDWKAKFREIGLQHARIEAAKESADDILSRGMDVAESAAKELARLKEVGRWKIAAREVSEDFDTRSEPPPPLPKPAPVVADEGEELVFEATEVDNESPKQDEAQKFEDNLDVNSEDEVLSDTPSDSIFSSEDSADDSESDAESLEQDELQQDELHSEANKVPFGAAAAAVRIEENAEDLSHDEVVDVEASKLSEALSQSLGVEELNAQPTASQDPVQNQAVEEILSKLLADKDASYAEEILKKLNAIYETQQPRAASAPTQSEETDPVLQTLVPENVEAPQELLIEKPASEPLVSAEDPQELESSTSTIVETEPSHAADVNEESLNDEL